MDTLKILKKVFSLFQSQAPKTWHECDQTSGNEMSIALQKELAGEPERRIVESTLERISLCYPSWIVDPQVIMFIARDSLYSGRRVESYAKELSPPLSIP